MNTFPKLSYFLEINLGYKYYESIFSALRDALPACILILEIELQNLRIYSVALELSTEEQNIC